METKKRKPDIELEKNDTTLSMSSSPTTLMSLRSGTVSIVEAVAVNLPDVFAAEIVPKLDWISTLNLAQVSKSYRDAVWSVPGLSSVDEKLHVAKMELGPQRICTEQLTPMCWAARHMNLPAVRAFVESGRLDSERGVNLRWPEVWIEYNGLHIAAKRGHEAVVKVLIDAGADVNIRSHGGTPLFLAALFGCTQVVHQLIKAGANVHLSDRNGLTPLAMAKNNGHCGCEKALIEAGA
jgi:hypothetical protein|tara:strand:+ start:2702 stop:3412 length:711 start_codon:yes stop_codon:yes gene_type:complete